MIDLRMLLCLLFLAPAVAFPAAGADDAATIDTIVTSPQNLFFTNFVPEDCKVTGIAIVTRIVDAAGGVSYTVELKDGTNRAFGAGSLATWPRGAGAIEWQTPCWSGADVVHEVFLDKFVCDGSSSYVMASLRGAASVNWLSFNHAGRCYPGGHVDASDVPPLPVG